MSPLIEVTKKDVVSETWEEPFYLNMGPQHPSTHGVLRIVLHLEGETIVDCDPIVGYLHRGVEKLGENLNYNQAIILSDRLDYIASVANNTAFALAFEKIFNLKVPRRAQLLRTIVCEMARICNHLLWLATHALDIGAMTVFLYCFRDREWLLNVFEKICGARLTHSYVRVGGVRLDFTSEIIDELYKFTEEFPNRILDYETLIDVNRIWLKRTKGIAVVSAEEAINLGLTGPCLRGSGVPYDVRKFRPYDAYEEVSFIVPTGKNGDTYDRYRVRMEELRQANSIIRQCLDKLPETEGQPVVADNAPDLLIPEKRKSAVALPHPKKGYFFKAKEEDVVPPGEAFASIESPKGELAVYVVSDGSNKPWRLRIRTPSFVHISAIPDLTRGHLIADLVAIIGTLDVVLGDSDR
ncbi:MAG: NADH-quinone oxidoreductase subunit D [Thermodesulfobacteriaceae bacterium]|nr:NADH-quinone oxidoreductase subunit D [Thermodesulfobacteriaceae bacterium]MCX8040913.1 NADH-quinone oxidoreductase subunit D [Thermodesulfobacteriaceae bacterium]MDW8136224.1 NADH-quinone oxidoreductase subunit D [Thermodesulfobacterium sp.]